MSVVYSEKELVDLSYQILQKKDNFENLSDQTIFRSIINRSYYGAFLKARNEAGLSRKNSGSIHADVIKHYANKRITKISNSLSDLRRKREEADYHTDRKISVQDAKASLKLARKVIKELEQNTSPSSSI